MNERVARRTGINWDWFLRYQPLPSQKCRIVGHWREHHAEIRTQDDGETFTILEKGQDKLGNPDWNDPFTKQRIANRVVIDDDWENPLEVVNPRYVFSYR